MRRTGSISVALLLAVVMIAAGAVWAFHKNWISRFMLSHSFGWVYRSIYQVIQDKTAQTRDQANLDRRLAAIRDYVNLTVNPKGKVADLGPVRVLINGQGWCDQVSDIYVRLIEPLNVSGLVAALRRPDGVSPHTLVYLVPDNNQWRNLSTLRKRVVQLQKTARVIDPMYGFEYRDKSGGFATPQQICRKDVAPNPIMRLNSLFCQNPRFIMVNQPQKDAFILKRLFYENIFEYC
jgi:hypothetical protein